ncbi:adhesive plaque matrix protein 2-like [Pomacea canaliculata]|uniref:adhesive plaque matrix protein 2-like n=1 Tax=Pomacea canaliculata TaxID=400727 RepID=UPI000D727D2C|nr:adhesive plaque matrix protein 2-like [Pomacea canaliculata]
MQTTSECGDNMLCFIAYEQPVCECSAQFQRDMSMSCVRVPQRILGSECRQVSDCGQNMECSPSNASGLFICQCASQFLPSADMESCYHFNQTYPPQGSSDCKLNPQENSGDCMKENPDEHPECDIDEDWKGLGDRCSTMDECGLHMVCIGQPGAATCRWGVLGSPCTGAQDCGDGMECAVTGLNRTCRCSLRYVARQNGSCGLAFGQHCSRNEDCADYMMCSKTALSSPACSCIQGFIITSSMSCVFKGQPGAHSGHSMQNSTFSTLLFLFVIWTCLLPT